jgi:hypothetical protein
VPLHSLIVHRCNPRRCPYTLLCGTSNHISTVEDDRVGNRVVDVGDGIFPLLGLLLSDLRADLQQRRCTECVVVGEKQSQARDNDRYQSALLERLSLGLQMLGGIGNGHVD